MSDDYVPSYKALNQKVNKQPKTLFMAPVFVKRHENDVDQAKKNIQHGDCGLAPTKETPTPCDVCNPPLTCYTPINPYPRRPKESYTQTSKTIIQLAQMEQNMPRLQKFRHASKRKPSPTPERDRDGQNTLDFCEDLDADQDFNLRGECDDKFSVDSLNFREAPEKENPIHHTKATRDLQEFINLRDANNLRLNQWVDNIKLRPVTQSICRVSPISPINSTLGVGVVSLHGRSKYSLCTTPSLVKREINVKGNRNMTSFHSLIQLHNEEAGNTNSNVIISNDIDGVAHTGSCDKIKNEKKARLGVWHSQIQYGLDVSSDHCMPPSLHDDDKTSFVLSQQNISNIASTSRPNMRSKSLVSNVASVSRHTTETADKTPKVFAKFGSASLINSMAASSKHIHYCCKPPKDGATFMSPTLSSERKSLRQQVESVRFLVGSKFRGMGAAASPKMARGCKTRAEIPFTRMNKARAVKSEELGTVHQVEIGEKIPAAFSSSTLFGSNSSTDNGFFLLLNRIKSTDFNSALKGLAEIINTARHTSREVMMPYMTLINQRLLELLKSPRSHVARTACQLTGHFFEVMKDTRRPEFDDIINTLLYKTADASKFIRQDANMALDAMVTHIPVFHAVRSVCAKGPTHRNPLVRCAAIRLLICAVVIAGSAGVMNYPAMETTRKRIIENLGYFLDDKNVDTRKYAERLYKLLHKEGTFDFYAKKYLNRTKHDALMSAIKTLSKRPA